jgi:hypothetical protein
MIITPTREPKVGETTDPVELLIREARAASRRRRLRVLAVVIAVLVLTLTGFLVTGNSGPAKHANTPVNTEAKSVAGAKASFPATLKMRRGLYDGGGHNPAPAWGAVLPVAQSQWIKIKSSGPIEWGVWRPDGDGGLFPVRSIDGGVRWTAAGPQLATDWAGGGIYYVSKVIADGLTSVVMVSNAVIDVTTDGGRRWFQYLNPASDWVISSQAVSVSIGLRIRMFPDGKFTKRGYATYVLNTTRHEWVRTGLSLG